MPLAPSQRRIDAVARAWRQYLRETQHLRKDAYERAEPWSWAQLQAQLKKAKAA